VLFCHFNSPLKTSDDL